MLTNKKKDLVFFDVDNTIFNGYTQKCFIKYLYKNKYIKFIDLIFSYIWFIFYKLNFVKNIDIGIKFYLRFLKGLKYVDFLVIVENFFNDNKDLIFDSAKYEIKNHIENNRQIILVSTSLYPIVDLIRKYVGADDLIATKLENIGDKLTGNIDGFAVYGDRKLYEVKKYISNYMDELINIKTYFYSDHHSDYELLNYVDYPVVVNPDNKLHNIAVKNNWKILNYKK
ncbi:HAD-IB family hydrolase [Candidatus Parcubacteria bacterium]|nr:MAG: HAD-IB family hydrolase [Candidatus Parcubacteria bacterium]